MDFFSHVIARIDHRINLTLSREQLEKKNLRKFRRLASYARKHSPYYARIMDEAGINPQTCRPEDFPVMTKSEVMEHFDTIVTDPAITKKRVSEFLASSKNPLDLFENRYYVLHTSGSSGEIGLFVYSPEDIARGLAQGPTPPFVGLRKCRMAFFGATHGHFAGVSFISSFGKSVLKFLFDIGLFEINSPLSRVVGKLNDFQPDALSGYATGLKILAEKQMRGELNINPKMVISSGEPINRDQREAIESAFNAPLINNYMCTEHIYLGISTLDTNGMYLLENELIFECHEDHTCVTNLFNKTMPLIRYRMEDILRPIENEHPVFPFIKIHEVVGRNESIPYFKNSHGEEDFISPHIINELYVKNLRRFQLQVVDREHFDFKIIARDDLSNEEHETMLSETRQKLRLILSEKDMENVAFEINEVPDLPVDPKTGKFKLILN